MKRLFQLLVGFVGLMVLLALVEYLPAPRDTVVWDRAFDTGHILIFGIVAVLCLTITRACLGDYRWPWQYLASCTAAMGLGVLLELWQSTRGRTAEWIDIYCDAIGIAVFTAGYACMDLRICPRPQWLQRGRLSCGMAVALLLGILPLLHTLNMYRVRWQILPSLVDWEQPWNDKFYYVRSGQLEAIDTPREWPDDAEAPNKVAKLTLTGNSRYPGLVFHEPYGDWGDFQAIEIDVLYDTTTATPFHFRFHDLGHNGQYDDRFNTQFLLQPGFQTLHFPIRNVHARSGRLIDVRNIDSCAIFTTQLDSPIVLYIGDMRLVR